MVSLSTSTAIARVRKNLDEILPNDSNMYIPSGDNNENPSLDDVIKRNLPEAINAVHLSAPATSLVGDDATFADNEVSVDTDGVMTFEINSTADILRIVSFKAKDSAVVVTDVLEESSPEGRKQLNRFIRGRSDRPRLVRSQGDKKIYKYYTLSSAPLQTTEYTPSEWIDMCKYLPVLKYNITSPAASYQIDSESVEQNVIDCLTGMVLETYSQPEKAKTFYDRSIIFH